jgi:hypothetical protein
MTQDLCQIKVRVFPLEREAARLLICMLEDLLIQVWTSVPSTCTSCCPCACRKHSRSEILHVHSTSTSMAATHSGVWHGSILKPTAQECHSFCCQQGSEARGALLMAACRHCHSLHSSCQSSQNCLHGAQQCLDCLPSLIPCVHLPLMSCCAVVPQCASSRCEHVTLMLQSCSLLQQLLPSPEPDHTADHVCQYLHHSSAALQCPTQPFTSFSPVCCTPPHLSRAGPSPRALGSTPGLC